MNSNQFGLAQFFIKWNDDLYYCFIRTIYIITAINNCVLNSTSIDQINYFIKSMFLTRDNKEKVLNVSNNRVKERNYNLPMLARYETKERSGKILYQGSIVKSFINVIMGYNSCEVTILYYINRSLIVNYNQTSIDQIPELSIVKIPFPLKTCSLFCKNLVLYIDARAIIKSLLEILDKLDIIESDVNKMLDEFVFRAKGHSRQSMKTTTELQDLTNVQLHSSILLRSILDFLRIIPKNFNQFKLYKNDILQYTPENDLMIQHVTDHATRRYVDQIFNLNNRYSNSVRVKNVFKIYFAPHNRRFKQKLFFIGNKQYAWHGTEKKNIASILTRGLLLPGERSEKYELNYGPGIYFSSSASKSLSYCKDWIDKSSLNPTTNFLILVSVAVGKHCVPSKNGPFPTKGFDSTWAHRLDGYYRDELVVYSEAQVRVDYVVEVEKY